MSDDKVTEEDRRTMVRGMLALHSTIAAEISKQQVDPVHLMRLIATGMNQTILALAYQLSTDGSVSLRDETTEEGPNQMKLFREDE